MTSRPSATKRTFTTRLVALAPLLLSGCDLGDVGEADDLGELSAAFAPCSASASDPDGDGWGWEPAHSCVRAGSGLGNGSYPSCSASASDPDGDGWGWEPAHSCQMRGGGSGTPTCSSGAIDPDGDGWGWEPDAQISCRMPPGGGGAGACTYVDGSCTEGSSGCRVYNDDGARAEVKAEIWQHMYGLTAQGLEGLPASTAEQRRAEARCRADLAVAMAMQEAHSFAVDGSGHLPYDWTKDGRTDGAQNVCIFNMNIDFLKRSCKQDCGRFQDFSNQDDKKYLNRRTSLRECVRRLDEAFDHFGIDGTLHFHRGGSAGWQHPGDDERGFARAQKVVADHLRDHPEFRSNGARAAETIPHR